jgi:putative sigma-54 modulation protein
MEMTFTGRGVPITDEVREAANRKFATLDRLEPRVTGLELELISEHHPRIDGLTRVEAALRIPRKTFRATAEAPEIPAAIDAVKDKLERQLRDHHGRRRLRRLGRRGRGLESAASQTLDEDAEDQEA